MGSVQKPLSFYFRPLWVFAAEVEEVLRLDARWASSSFLVLRYHPLDHNVADLVQNHDVDGNHHNLHYVKEGVQEKLLIGAYLLLRELLSDVREVSHRQINYLWFVLQKIQFVETQPLFASIEVKGSLNNNEVVNVGTHNFEFESQHFVLTVVREAVIDTRRLLLLRKLKFCYLFILFELPLCCWRYTENKGKEQ